MWQNFGFQENPYATEPVPATEEGDHLLVGREDEIRKLESRILAGGNHPTLEGDNGVGKTSLLQVVCYRLRTAFEEGRSAKLFLPLEEFFQPTSSPDNFVKKVYFQVASAIVREYDILKRHAVKVPNIADVKTWLNAPIMRSIGTSVSIFGSGGEVTRGRATNTSEGFTDSGFMAIIDTWLRQLFPTSQSGGFICAIDNLELLETTQDTRALLEAIRDPLLNRRGLRWILCGARGIVRTSVSSPRLEGRLAEPLEILPISDEYVAAAVKRRIEVCGFGNFAVPPVGPDTFRYLYDVLHQNLRNAFKYAEDFSHWLVNENAVSGNAHEYHDLFQVWLTTQADAHLQQTDLRNRAWKVFDDLATRGGWCSPSDFRQFGFNSPAAMRPHIKSLEQENLVSTTLNDESDKRRKTIVMTPRAWLSNMQGTATTHLRTDQRDIEKLDVPGAWGQRASNRCIPSGLSSPACSAIVHELFRSAPDNTQQVHPRSAPRVRLREITRHQREHPVKPSPSPRQTIIDYSPRRGRRIFESQHT